MTHLRYSIYTVNIFILINLIESKRENKRRLFTQFVAWAQEIKARKNAQDEYLPLEDCVEIICENTQVRVYNLLTEAYTAMPNKTHASKYTLFSILKMLY